MKRFIFGCVLMIVGVMGGSAWLIAYSNLVEPGAWSSMFNVFPFIGFGRKDGICILLFYILAIVGAVIAIKELRKDK